MGSDTGNDMKLSQKHTLNCDNRNKNVTKSQLAKLKEYWGVLQILKYEYFRKMDMLEKKMRKDKDLGISDLIIHWVDWEPVGFGNESRTMRLLQHYELSTEP